ncbi:MAG TPA: hypothetical protein VLF40_00070 [Candidatus Saccharimonadales bacterium]|nr:hypothetical protein [Candidatus Saccharimonadales bacterium]
MSAPTIERSPAVEVAPEVYDPGALIHATIEASYSDIEAQKQQLDEITAKAVAGSVDPLTAEAVSTLAGIYRWKMFGERGDPLPAGLIKYASDKRDAVHMAYDPRLFDYDSRRACNRILAEAGMDDLLQLRTDQRQANMPAIKESIRRGVVTSPAYELASAFCGELFREPQELPLSPLERMRREKVIEDDVRKRFGLEDNEAIERRSMADTVLRRAIFRLDDETLPRKEWQSEPDDGIARARRYFLGVAQDCWDRICARQRGSGNATWGGDV